MAGRHSLKLVKTGTSTLDPPSYISVVDKIVLDAAGLEDFGGDDEDAGFTKRRTKKLIDSLAAGAEIQQEDENGVAFVVKPKNTRIRANTDESMPDSTSIKKPSRVTISLPARALNLADLDYTENLVLEFLKIYTANAGYALPAPGGGSARTDAWKFLFGTMLLTKCR